MLEEMARAVEHQRIRGLKRIEYDELVKLGVFGDERLELMFGSVVQMSPIDPAHCEAVAILHETLLRALASRARIRCQSSFAATDDSEPEPDILVTPPRSYWTEHPARAYLVIEVARSSLAYDRNEKAFLYGVSEVDEYWIVDHVHGLVEVRRDRREGRWCSLQTFRRGDSIALLAFPDVSIAVSEILPPE
jgi:Uma2 family endonuclease